MKGVLVVVTEAQLSCCTFTLKGVELNELRNTQWISQSHSPHEATSNDGAHFTMFSVLFLEAVNFVPPALLFPFISFC